MTGPTLAEAATLLTTDLRPNNGFLAVGVAEVPEGGKLIVYVNRRARGAPVRVPDEWYGYKVERRDLDGGFMSF